QISILNTIIENNLKIIKQLEEKQSSYKNLHEEIELLKNTLLDLTKRKIKKDFLYFNLYQNSIIEPVKYFV
ncbi:hypothetical protein CYK65_09730, partial [Clostridium perfringens]